MIWTYKVVVCVSCVQLGIEPGCGFYFSPHKGGIHKVWYELYFYSIMLFAMKISETFVPILLNRGQKKTDF